MKKLIIVSTKPDGGVGGGIPSALIGYMDGFDSEGISYQVIESHAENRGVLSSWFIAFWKIIVISIQHRGQVVFWFHCGQWLSIVRKFSLALIPRLLGNKTIIHIHSPTFYDYLSTNKATESLVKLSLLPFSEVVVLTSWWKELLFNYGIDKKITISPNPNSTRYCKIAQSYSQSPLIKIEKKQKVKILSMARLIEGKGVDLVIEALSLLSDEYTLTVAGNGPLKDVLEQQAIELGVYERITFTGWIDGQKKEQLLADADIFCLPSRYDSFGMVFIEAMAFNLPVIAYGWGPIQDVVTEDVGLCCLKASAQEISCHINKISTQLEKYQGFGPTRVLKHYTPAVVVTNFIKLLN